MPESRRTLFGMDRQSGRLAGAGGFHGPPASPLKVGSGWPDSENVALVESGDALRTLWGYRRSFNERLWDGIPRERLEVWAVPALEALGLDAGIGLAVVDGLNGRILGVEYNDAAPPVTAKKLLFLMNRQGNHDYTSSVTVRGKTHIFTGWTEPVVHDGLSARLAGIRSPKRKPVIGVSGGGGFASLRNARYYWTQSADVTPMGQFFVRSSDTTNPGMNQNPSIANKPSSVKIDGAVATAGTLGSLAVGEWAYGDLDTLGYKTLYVRLIANADPDSQAEDFIQHSPMRIDSFKGITDASGDANLWFSAQGAVTVMNADATVPLSPAPDQDRHLKLSITNAVVLGNLAFAGAAGAGLAGEVIPPSNANSFYVWVYVGGSGFTIAPNTLKIKWTDATLFTGKEQSFLIAQTLNAGWNQVFFDYIAPSDVPLFDIKSIAIVLEQAFAPEVSFPLELRFDEMTFSESKEASGGPGQFRARFSWFDSKRLRESDPSPISDSFFITAGGTLAIDLGGNLPGIDSGSQNINPAMHSIVDPDHAWTLSGAGAFNYYLTDQNVENPVVAVKPFAVRAGGVLLAEGTLGALAAGQWAYGDADGLLYDTIYVRLTGDLDPDSQIPAFVVYQDDTVDRARIYIHRDDFGLDDFGRPVFGLVSPNMGDVIPFQNGPDFAAVVNVSADFDQNALIDPERAPNYFRAVPEPLESVVLDTDVIIGGGQGDFAVGMVNVDGVNKSIVTPVSSFMNTPRFRYWMEGRDFFAENDPKKYFIAQVYSGIGYGKPDKLRIAFIDPFNTDEVIDGYQGGAGDKKYRIPGRADMIFWTAKTAREGVYTEAMPLVNRLDCRMTGDSIRAVDRIREVIMVAGRKTLYNLVQDKLAVDDLILSSPRFSQPLERRGFPGIMARRSQETFADGTAGFLGNDADLVIGSGASFQKSQLSQRVRGFLSTEAKVDTEALIHAHAIYKRRRNCLIEHLIESDPNATGCETAEQALAAIQNPPTWISNNPKILMIGTNYGNLNDAGGITQAIINSGGINLGLSGSEIFETVDLGEANVLVFEGASAANALVLDPNTANALLWEPNAAVTAKALAFLLAGGNILIFDSGHERALAPYANANNEFFDGPGPGHAWEWISSAADPSLPGPFLGSYDEPGMSSIKTAFADAPPDDENRGWFLSSHYIVRNLFADHDLTGSGFPSGPLTGDEILDFNANNMRSKYFNSIGSGMNIVARGGAFAPSGPGLKRKPAILAGSVGTGKLVLMGGSTLNNFWGDVFGIQLLTNIFDFFGLGR